MSERSPALADFLAQLPFELDAFQEAAIAALDAGRSVVVCAPTGSGKTLIGEYAIHRALTRQQRVFYTTPSRHSPTRSGVTFSSSLVQSRSAS